MTGNEVDGRVLVMKNFIGAVFLIAMIQFVNADQQSSPTVDVSRSISPTMQGTSSKHAVVLNGAQQGKIEVKQTGVLVDLMNQGPVIFSPLAPASLGYGQKYLTTNSNPRTDSYKRYPSTATTYNGIKLIGWEF